MYGLAHTPYVTENRDKTKKYLPPEFGGTVT
jgi:hypothetical protein